MGDETVRVFAVGKKHKAQAVAGLEMRQRQMGGAMGGLQARRIAVKCQDGFGRGTPQKMQLVFGQRRAKRRNGMGKACAHQRDHIHIAFGDDDRAGFDGRCARRGKIVKLQPLGKERSFAGIDVFGLGVGFQCAGAKSHDAAAPVADGKHHPVVEEIAHRAAIIGRAGQAGGDDVGLGDVLRREMLDQGIVARGRIAQAKLFRRRAVQPAPFQVIASLATARLEQLRFVKLRRQFNDVVERFFLLLTLFVFRRPFGQFDADFRRQLFHGFRKRQAFGFGQPLEGVAALAAAETFVEAALILDLEAGGFLGMEGAAAPHHPALAHQLDAAAHQRDQIGPPPDFFQQSFAIAHGAILGAKRRQMGAADPRFL